MEPTINDYLPIFWSILGIFAVGMAYKLLKFFIVAKTETKGALKMQISELKELVDHHKKEAARWRGRFGNHMSKPTVENGNPEDPESFIPNLISQFGHMAPDWIKPFLNDQNMIKFLIDQAKKNPDAAKSILTNFVGIPKNKSTNAENIAESGTYSELA